MQNDDDGVGDQSTVHLAFVEDCPERLPMSQIRAGNTNGHAAEAVDKLSRLANRGWRVEDRLGNRCEQAVASSSGELLQAGCERAQFGRTARPATEEGDSISLRPV